ncbi:P-loop containing nucleoside triphosphate hydrolase protein [Scenedesmus sp. NREL 46B-D3]|nr:P-loop containing nucleoside triphosphate hydrolase protein [Scenedesmus sp. NREL 46B-D3]
MRSSLAKSLESLTAAADGPSSSLDAALSTSSRYSSRSNVNSGDGSSGRSGRAQAPQLAGRPAAQGEYQAAQLKQQPSSGGDMCGSSAEAAADSSTKASAGMLKSTSNTALAPTAGVAGGGSSNSSSQPKWRSSLKHYYRYYLPPADVDDETGDLTQRVQEAAGAALAEANERLMEAELKLQAAQAAQQQLQQQLAAAEQLAAEVEQLKGENLEAWRVKYELEGQMAATKASLEGMQRQGSSMHKELEAVRQQAQIWSDVSSSEVQKMRAEGGLLTGQLAARSAELAGLRQQLTEVEAERDRALQERQQALEEREKLHTQLQQVGSLQQQLAAASAAAAAATSAASVWEEKFMRERAVRRKLHEQLQVLRGNIRVMCRIRPPHQQQQQSPSRSPAAAAAAFGATHGSCISYPLEGLLAVHDASTARQRDFEFDAVYAPEASQQQASTEILATAGYLQALCTPSVFEEVSPLVRSCADGCNVCIFAYGQTGSGKTFTMDGPADNPGINARALQELFCIAADEVDHSWSFQVAMLEIYNEAVRDLLAMSASMGGAALQPQQQRVPRLVWQRGVPGLVWRRVSTPAEVRAALREGARARATAATALNAASSRSHALVCVKVQGVREGRAFTTMMHLVDLAGSERVDKSEVTGQQLKEAQAINKSLSALGDVVAALQRRGAHIPFRNSKLTQVLQDSLCGSSKVLLVCNLSPEPASCSESLSSLNFASRAAQVELGQARRTPAAAGSSSTAADAAADAAGSPGRGGSSSSSAAAAAAGGTDRGSSSSPTKMMSTGTHPLAAGGGSVRTSGSFSPGGLAAAAVRPGSRLSERAAAAGAAGGMSSIGSPRLSASSTAKPARH